MGEAHGHPTASQVLVILGVLVTSTCGVLGDKPVIFDDILRFYGGDGSLTPSDIDTFLDRLSNKPIDLGDVVSKESKVCFYIIFCSGKKNNIRSSLLRYCRITFNPAREFLVQVLKWCAYYL